MLNTNMFVHLIALQTQSMPSFYFLQMLYMVEVITAIDWMTQLIRYFQYRID